MDYDLGAEADELRKRLRAVIADEVSTEFRGALGNDPVTNAISDRFCKRLGEEGLLTINWPREYGGSDGDVWSQAVIREEMWAHHEPRGPQYMGLNWVGPALMRFGTADQQELHLPPIAAGESHWCQGFSEPGAGSDLASLSLSAAKAEDGSWRLNGQKIWTSYAEVADWCFLTTRSDRAARKHAGITVFLVPMTRPGIEVRQIDSLMGKGHLHEVFFDDVVAYDDEILGHPGQGWEIIRAVLDFERVGIARYARSDRLLHDLWEYGAHEPQALAGELGARHARSLVHTRIARLLSYRVVARRDDGAVSSGDPAVARLASTTLDQELGELAMEMLGADALSNDHDAPLDGFAEDAWRYSRAAGIASGTTEIQRLLVARDLAATRGLEQ
jgi:alkylation response protein AidB-like acyl-CoA dehydrogenase